MKEIPWLLQSWKMEKLKFDYHGGDSESAVPKIGSSSSPFTVEDRTPAGFPYWNRQPCHIGHRAWVANKGTLLDILLIRLPSFCLRRRCAGEPFIPAWNAVDSYRFIRIGGRASYTVLGVRIVNDSYSNTDELTSYLSFNKSPNLYR